MSNWNKLKQKIGASETVSKPKPNKSQSKYAVKINPEEAKALNALKRVQGRMVALDCEMVGTGMNGKYSELARCSMVDGHGQVLYDEFVQPKGFVTDFRTQWSGIRKSDINKSKAVPLEHCQEAVMKLLKGKMLVGHALQNDLKVLMLSHPKMNIRDTSRYPPFMRILPNGKRRARALKDLTKQFLQKTIQTGEHDSVEDARCALELYLLVQNDWELYLRQKKLLKQPQATTATTTASTAQDSKTNEEIKEGTDGGESEQDSEDDDYDSCRDHEQEAADSYDENEGEILEKLTTGKRSREENKEEERHQIKKSMAIDSTLSKNTDGSTSNSSLLLSQLGGKEELRRAWVTKQQRRDQRKQHRQRK